MRKLESRKGGRAGEGRKKRGQDGDGLEGETREERRKNGVTEGSFCLVGEGNCDSEGPCVLY